MKIDDLIGGSGSMAPSRAQHSQQQWLAALELAQRDAGSTAARPAAAPAPDLMTVADGALPAALAASRIADAGYPVALHRRGAPTASTVAAPATGAVSPAGPAARGAPSGSLRAASLPSAPGAPAESRWTQAGPASSDDRSGKGPVEREQGALAAWVESLEWAPQVAHASVLDQRLHVSIRAPDLGDAAQARLLRQIRVQAERWGLGVGEVTVNGRVLAGDPVAPDCSA